MPDGWTHLHIRESTHRMVRLMAAAANTSMGDLLDSAVKAMLWDGADDRFAGVVQQLEASKEIENADDRSTEDEPA